jgi:uncharacterized protein YxjI
MPRAAEASRLLLRAAAAQRAWWAAGGSSPSSAPPASSQLLGRWSSAAATPWSSSPALGSAAIDQQHRTFASAEAAARARRLAAAQLRRQQQHERAAARLARAPPASSNNGDNTALAPAPPTPLADVDPGSLPQNDALAVARAVAHPALIVTRAIEWGTVVLGFEQANKYTVYDQDGQIVALIAEDETGLGNAVGRQVLRTRRAFTATVLSPQDGSVIFRVRRPAYLVSSTTYVETGDGTPIGEVRQRWHPLRRNFDLYVASRQYARISGPLLAWEFQLTDDSGRTLALIDRNFQGFAKELFTDAGKYVVHFGLGADESAEVATRTLRERSGRRDFGAVQPLQITGASPSSSATATTAATTPPTDAVAVIPQVTGGQLAVARPLALDERMVALAAAVAIDFAFFSQHSHTSGMFAPPLLFPMPLPGGGGVGGGPAAEEAGGGEGAAPVGGAGEGAAAGGGGGFGGGEASTAAGAGGGAGGAGAASGGDEGWSWDDSGSGDKGGGEGGDSGWSPWGGGDGGDDAGDDGEGGGTVGSVVRGLWRVFGDDD